MGVLRVGRLVVPKAPRRSDSSQSLGSAPAPLALCDVGMVAAVPTVPAPSTEQTASCLVKMEALESNLAELRNLSLEAEVRSD